MELHLIAISFQSGQIRVPPIRVAAAPSCVPGSGEEEPSARWKTNQSFGKLLARGPYNDNLYMPAGAIAVSHVMREARTSATARLVAEYQWAGMKLGFGSLTCFWASLKARRP